MYDCIGKSSKILCFGRYDHDKYNRGFSIPGQSSLDTIVSSNPRIRKELVDQRVIEGHIVPHRLIFTSHAPTTEYQTVAWLKDGMQVNISLQVSLKLTLFYLSITIINIIYIPGFNKLNCFLLFVIGYYRARRAY